MTAATTTRELPSPSTRPGTAHWTWRWFLPVLTGVIAGVSAVGLASAAGVLISRAALRPEDFLSLGLFATAVRAFGVARAGGRYAERVTGHVAALALAVQLRLDLFDRVCELDADATQRDGDILSRAHTDIDLAVMYVLRVVVPAVTCGVVFGGFAAWALLLHPWLAIAIAVPSGLFAALVVQTARRAGDLADQETACTRAHAAGLLDALAASQDGAALLLRPRLDSAASRLDDVQRRQSRLGNRLTFARESLLAGCLGVLYVVGLRLVDAGELAAPVFTGLILGTIAFFEVLGVLAGVPRAIQQRRSSAQRSLDMAARRPGVVAPERPVPLPDGPTWFELQSVGVVRGGRTVLHDVTLTIAPGERIVVRGPSGGGKTTLLRVLGRRLETTTGSVLCSGVDVRTAHFREVRRRVAMHFQDAPLLDGTIEENLRLGARGAASATLESMLGELDVPYPLSHQVGEGGSRISGGERARISLARALLSPADVLLLDEPTAHLDAATEQGVLDAIVAHSAAKSVVLVTHRRGPTRIADRVLTLAAGTLPQEPVWVEM